MFPLVDLSFSEGDESGREFGIGDLSVWLRYGVALGGVRKPLKIGAAAGVGASLASPRKRSAARMELKVSSREGSAMVPRP